MNSINNPNLKGYYNDFSINNKSNKIELDQCLNYNQSVAIPFIFSVLENTNGLIYKLFEQNQALEGRIAELELHLKAHSMLEQLRSYYALKKFEFVRE